MATILKKIKCDILAAVQPILMKFGMTLHISHPTLTGNQKFENPRWRMVATLKIKKSWYLRNHLADFDKILHDDAY